MPEARRNDVPGVMIADHARERAGMPPEWSWYHLETFPHSRGSEPPLCFIVKGAVAPLKQRGPGAGKLRNWKKRDPATDTTVYIKPEEHLAWLAAYEARTGNCFNCQGTKQEAAGWNIATGTTWRSCSRCKGSGKPSEDAKP